MSNPLTLHHEKLGAHLDSSSAPMEYSDPVEEYWSIKKAVGLADLSHTGRLRIVGKDRISFLNNLLTNDISHLPEGGGQHTALLTNKARVLADLYLYNQPDAVLVDTGYSAGSKVKESLDRFIITEDVEIRDMSHDLVHMSLQGPNSATALKETLKTGVDDLQPLSHKAVGPTTVISRDRTGLGGYDLTMPPDEAEAVWQGFLLGTTDAGLRPVGQRALEILRLEAGYPRYGVDLDENTIILEAGFKDAMSFTKGCYLGQEVVARATHIGRVNKQLVKLEVESIEPPAQRSKLSSNGVEAGFVTSSAYSPGHEKTLGLAYATRDFAKEGTKLIVESGHEQLSAIVTKIV